ncbi:ATP-binding cassette domain-containing protein [Azospirillum thermophilum]|uniref:ABC transporter n=1 Tax=Azospirillum thermophilum TaxID=2202148 RepID=A0A2S2CML7_9PROT|nr:ATP-binding cassette domain-containing protein [Azospirillum thermophilum]AWK85721.1 ABC transporter [Azospirillum thermophilum]
MPADHPEILIENLSIRRPGGGALLDPTTLRIGPSEVVLLVGPSGGGKSTIVKLLGGLLEVGEGGWRVTGRLTLGDRRIDLAAERSDVGGIVFQEHALFDDLTAIENLRIAADHAPGRHPELMADATALLGDIGPHKRVSACSGGQRQRLAIARTVLADRPVLLFDEPNSGLDVTSARRLGELIRGLCRGMGKPALIVAHHVKDLLPIADRVLLLDTRNHRLVEVPPDAELVEAELLRVGSAPDAATDAAPDAGTAVRRPPAGERPNPWPAAIGSRSRGYWFLRYLAEYFWALCVSPMMLVYMGMGALIMGFVSMWFGFNYNSFGGFLKSLLHDETLVGVGLVQATVAVPLISSILFVARNNAIIAADIGNRVLSSQFKAMENLHIPARGYIFTAIILNMVVGSGLLLVMSLAVASWGSMETWHLLFPQQPRELWQDHFFRKLLVDGLWPAKKMGWVLLKVALSGFLAGGVAILIGMGRKDSVIAINTAIAQSIIAGVTITLLVHALVSVLTLTF